MNREDVLEAARDLTMGDRNKAYGDPTQNHNNITKLWQAYLEIRHSSTSMLGTIKLDAEDAEIMMALVKIARIAQRLDNRSDSFVDACAYIAMAREAREVTVANMKEPSTEEVAKKVLFEKHPDLIK